MLSWVKIRQTFQQSKPGMLPVPQRMAVAYCPGDWPDPAHSTSSLGTCCTHTQVNQWHILEVMALQGPELWGNFPTYKMLDSFLGHLIHEAPFRKVSLLWNNILTFAFKSGPLSFNSMIILHVLFCTLQIKIFDTIPLYFLHNLAHISSSGWVQA